MNTTLNTAMFKVQGSTCISSSDITEIPPNAYQVFYTSDQLTIREASALYAAAEANPMHVWEDDNWRSNEYEHNDEDTSENDNELGLNDPILKLLKSYVMR